MRSLIRALAAAALLCASVAHAASQQQNSIDVVLMRGADPIEPAPVSAADCETRKAELITSDAVSRTSGRERYRCIVTSTSDVTFTAGGPAVDCRVTPWSAWKVIATHPAECIRGQREIREYGMRGVIQRAENGGAACPETVRSRIRLEPCGPIDSDADGVPDSADECPTVHAVTPNGCPATPPNRAPTISGTPPTSVVAGTAYSFQPATADADGNALTHSIANRPSWASFNTSTGRLSGTPTPANVGAYSGIGIAVSDGLASASLAPFNLVVTAVPGGASLSWTPPARNTDGSALTDLAGYRIHYGRSATELAQTISVGNVSRYAVQSLASGTWYFALRAVNSAGAESELSNVVSEVVP